MHFYPNLKNLFVQWDVVDPITACCLPSQLGQTNKGWSHISATAPLVHQPFCAKIMKKVLGLVEIKVS